VGEDNILEIKNLSKSFPGVKALDKIDFSLRKGEVHALIGENGAGKSTFLKILSGNLEPDEGTIIYNNKEIRVKSTEKARNIGISMAYQELSLVPSLSVAENIFLGNYFYKKNGMVIDWEKTFQKAEEIMESYGLNIDVRKKVRNLGVGQQQLVEIIRAVSKDIKVLLLDEPTSALSRDEIDVLFNSIIKNMKKKDTAIIYISHRMEEAMEIADRVTVFRDGKKIKTLDIKETNEDKLIELMVGRQIEERYVKEEVEIGEKILEIKNLKAEGIIENCSLDVRRGEIVGLAGLMGAGRTEFAKTLIGLYQKDGGKVILNGREVEINNPQEALKNGIAYLAEDRNESMVYPLNIANNITLANLKEIFRNGILDKKKELRDGTKFIEQLNIETPGVRQKVRNLSGGNQQKVILARLIYSNVDVFILDEPTRGIDVGAKVEVYNLIARLLENEKAVILISSELPEIVSLSDRVFVMYKGSVVAEYVGEDITQENIMRSACFYKEEDVVCS
jgi:ribose transport system ATP-binding protein